MQSLNKKYRQLLRKKINKYNRDRLKYDPGNPFSIISSNCVGGVISHDLGLKFESPTVNLFFYPDSFLEYITHLREYSKLELIQIPATPNHPYPRAKIGNEGKVILNFMHYKTFDEANAKWIKRTKRINFNNLYFILSERDGLTYNQMKMFDQLPYQHKVLLTCHKYNDLKSAYCLGGEYMQNNELIDLMRYKGKFTGLKYLDDFDYVTFLNGEM